MTDRTDTDSRSMVGQSSTHSMKLQTGTNRRTLLEFLMNETNPIHPVYGANIEHSYGRNMPYW